MIKRVSYIVNRGSGGPRKEKKKPSRTNEINLTSLIDVLTILLVFLIKNVSMDAQKNNSPEGMKLVESITNESLIENGKTIVIKVFPKQILFGVESIPVGTLEDFATNTTIRNRLLNMLSEQSERIKAQNSDEIPSLLIQADRTIPCMYITEFIKLSSRSSFSNIYFSTILASERQSLLGS